MFLDDATAPRVSALVQESALRWACAALTQDLPGSTTARVRPELKPLHPASLGSAMFTGRLPLKPALTLSAALQSSVPSTGAHPCGFRPVYLREASHPATSEHTFFAFASPCGCTCGRLNGRSVDPTGRPGSPRSARRSAVSPWQLSRLTEERVLQEADRKFHQGRPP